MAKFLSNLDGGKNYLYPMNEFSNRQRIIAALLVLIGAIFFSAKAVLVKLAYQHEVDSVSLLALRMAFSVPLFLLVLYVTNKNQDNTPLRTRDLLLTILVGTLGYYVASLMDFLGLQYITASMERLILFMYPTLVVLLGAIFFKERINRAQSVALILTYLGIAIAFMDSLALREDDNFVLGALFIFTSALTYASFLVGSGQLIPRMGTMRFTSIAMIAAGSAVLIHHGIMLHWDLFGFTQPVYFLAMLMAIFCTVVPSFLVSEGIRIIGSSNASIIGSIGPISTIVLAYIFLEERLGWLQWLGTLVVIMGVLLISLQKKKS